VEHRPRFPLFVRAGRVRHGGRWFQGQVVRFNPRYYAQYLQCGCKQLVECTLRTSREGLPQVRYFSIRGTSMSLYTHWPLASCHTIADVPIPRYDFFQTLCKLIARLFNAHRFDAFSAIVGGLILLVNMGPGA
jgi:hypothetical protein